MTPDLRVKLGPLELRNPVMVASGTFGYGTEYGELVDFSILGAVMVKGISLEPHMGNLTPRMVEVPGGLVNAIGLQNPGVDAFLRDYLPELLEADVPVIANMWGHTVEEYAEVARRLSAAGGLAALEVNVSCPNIKEGSKTFGTQLDSFRRVVAAVRAASDLPLIPKLAPNVPSVAEFALAAAAEGADALSLINTLPAMVIDVDTRRPVLANITGGLSGPAIHPVAVKLVWDAARAVDLPVIGMGGIAEPRDAIEFLVAGATAVAVGTATFTDPSTASRVVQGLREFLQREGLASVSELVGSVRC